MFQTFAMLTESQREYFSSLTSPSFWMSWRHRNLRLPCQTPSEEQNIYPYSCMDVCVNTYVHMYTYMSREQTVKPLNLSSTKLENKQNWWCGSGQVQTIEVGLMVKFLVWVQESETQGLWCWWAGNTDAPAEAERVDLSLCSFNRWDDRNSLIDIPWNSVSWAISVSLS